MRLGTTEIILIIVLALILFGGTKISGIGRAFGQSIREFKEEVGQSKKEEASSEKIASTTTAATATAEKVNG